MYENTLPKLSYKIERACFMESEYIKSLKDVAINYTVKQG